jgi:3-methyl-2-oxobutanoate hydroxymethyltransferase
VDAARRLADLGADLVKVEGIEHVRVVAAAGIPVFAQIESAADAKAAEDAGAALIDFRHSGRDAGAEAVAAVSIPVLGGLGGGPWLDGRVRAVHKLLDDGLGAYVEDVRSGRPVKGD